MNLPCIKVVRNKRRVYCLQECFEVEQEEDKEEQEEEELDNSIFLEILRKIVFLL